MIKRRVAETDASGKPKKEKLPMLDLGVSLGRVLDEFQAALYAAARKRTEESTVFVDSWKEFLEVFRDGESRFVYAHWDGTTATELAIKEETKVTIRCLPYREDAPAGVFERGACVKTGQPSAQRVLFAKNY
jgi:prolyl-tRNA synthetase